MNKLSFTEKDEWTIFSLSFLNLAIAPIESEKFRTMSQSELEEFVEKYFIGIVFNIKHGIESFIKSLIILVEEKELDKSRRHHDTNDNWDYLMTILKKKDFQKLVKAEAKKHENEELYQYINERVDNMPQMLSDASDLIAKYRCLSFLKEKIGPDYLIEDPDNTAFKYPQNNLKIKLDYTKILSKITRTDLLKIAIDAANIGLILTTYGLAFEAYIGGQK